MAGKRRILGKRIVKLFVVAVLGLILTLNWQWLSKATEGTTTVARFNFNWGNGIVSDASQNWSNLFLASNNLDLDDRSFSLSFEQLLDEGIKAYQNGQFAKAKEFWQQALQSPQTDELSLALVWNYLSLAFQQLGEWEQASRAIATSFYLLESNLQRGNSRQRLQILARSQLTFGRLLLAQGQADKALNTLKQAEVFYQQLNDRQGVIGSQINQAQALQAMGRYRRALQILTSIRKNLKQEPDSLLKITGLFNLGNVLQAVGDLENSWCVFKESLPLAQSLRSEQLVGDIYLSLGNTARSFGKRLQSLQNIPSESQKDFLPISEDCNNNVIESNVLGFAIEAKNLYNRAVELEASSPMTKLQAQLNQLNLFLETKSWSEAQQLWPKIYEQISNFSASRKEIYARINLARSLTKLKQQSSFNLDWGEIEQILQTAIQHAKTLEDLRAESYAIGNRGWLYEQKKDWDKAKEITKVALEIAKKDVNAPDVLYQWLWQLGRLYAQTKEDEEAIAAYQEAVITLDSLRKNLVGINLDLEGINSNAQFYFRDNVEPVYRELVDLLLKPENRNQNNLKQARETISKLQVAELENFLHCTVQVEEPKSLDLVADEKNAAIIYPIILPHKLAALVKFPQQEELLYFEHPVEQSELENQLEFLRRELETDPFGRKGKQVSQELYERLIRPAEPILNSKNIKTLVFVLDGKLRNIPMAALWDGERYLVEKYASALNLGLELPNPQPLKQKDFVLLAAGISKEIRGLSPLPNVERELNAIKPFSRRQLRDEQFLSRNLQSLIQLRPFTVVHLATHAEFSSRLEKTAIEAWDTPINVTQLNEIFLTQSQNRPEPIELLVMSACRTAIGDRRTTLGLAGIAVESGARSTIASLWYLNDESSAVLMERFYHHLKDPNMLNKAEALRRAQEDLLNNRPYRLPRFWAPFILLGNWL